MKVFYATLALAVCLAFGQQVRAENDGIPHAAPPHHHSTSPEERAARHAAIRQKMKNMSPEERTQFLSELKTRMQQRYDQAPPEQKERLKERIEKLDERMNSPQPAEMPR